MGALAALGAAGAAAGVGIWRAVSGGGGPQATRVGSARPPTLDELARHIRAGGPGRNGIPPINRPEFVQPADATFLRDQDPVFGFVYRGDVRAYPQLVLVWHEIVNDVVAGERISVTYCPLTGSVVAFRATARGRPLTFGTTGNLVNSNLLMFDDVTNSEWPQVLGQAIRGPLEGHRLEQAPLVWASWGRWRAAHPETTVLSTKTGYARAYGQDPYGSYAPLGGYYSSGGPFFPVLRTSKRFGSKQVFVGVRSGEARLAILKSTIRERKVLSVEAGPTPLVAVWDDQLGTARVFARQARGRTLEFRAGELRDATGTSWSPYRWAALGAALLYVLVYLVAIQDIDISTSGRFSRFAAIPSAQVVPDWQNKLFAERAPYLYEPVAIVYLLPQLAWFVSVGNISIAAALALPLALSVSLALYSVSTAKACGRFAYTGLLGVLPTFLLGFGCCAPTIILLLGTGVAAALVPVRSYLFPLAFASMGLMLVWMSWRLRVYGAELLQRVATGAPAARDREAVGRSS